MGGSSFSHDDWTRTSSTYSKKSASEIYRASGLDESIDPSKMKGGIREACDSDANPNSTPIIIGLDFTGSMRNIPEYMIKSGLGELFKEIYDRKPVSDPQVLFCGIGDVDAGDPAPFQVGQFESQCDRLITGLEKFWLRGCMGGGNDYESRKRTNYIEIGEYRNLIPNVFNELEYISTGIRISLLSFDKFGRCCSLSVKV